MDRSFEVAARKQDALKEEMTAKVAKARQDAVQEFKKRFKDMVDYL